MSDIGLIILAAGASRRMGTPKQLLRYGGISLLRHTVNVALKSPCTPVIVVLGAYCEQIQPEVADLPIHSVQNPDWEQGMGTSIRAGVKALNRTSPNAVGVVVTVCDQPCLSVAAIAQLVDAYHLSNQPIVASEYADTVGVPALFDLVLSEELIALKGTEGAKQVIQRYGQEVFRISWPEGAIDLDTPEDYTKLIH
jgi:molybdenum cofactor cytidylyltransferase